MARLWMSADPAARIRACSTAMTTAPTQLPPLDTRRPFSRADALAAGISAKALRGSRFRRLFRDVYVDVRMPSTPLLRVQGALALFDRTAYASHASAARLYDLPIPATATEHISVLARRHRRRPTGVLCHLQPDARVRIVSGVRVSYPGQMFVELACSLGLLDLVVVGDAMVRRGLSTPEDLVLHCAESGEVGAVAARVAAAYVRSHVDSPMESRLRMLLVLAGCPEPEVNLTVRDFDGEPTRRYDLSWPAIKSIVEYDGRHHIERRQQWESDLERREEIDDNGWRIIVITSSGIYRDPERTLGRVWRLLGSRSLAGLPARPSDDWRPHFGR